MIGAIYKTTNYLPVNVKRPLSAITMKSLNHDFFLRVTTLYNVNLFKLARNENEGRFMLLVKYSFITIHFKNFYV